MEVLWFVIAVLVVVAVFLFMIFPAVRRHPDRELMNGMYIAHRGLHSQSENTPENSLAAFKAAVDAKIAIETDIHITADGEVVIFHDDTLQRMCADPRRPEDLTLRELKELRLAGGDQRIPTLKECLQLVDGRVPLLIEFKTKSPKTCTPLCRAANEILKDYKGKYFIQSFYPFVPYWYRKNRKDILRGQLSSGYFKEKGLHMKMLSCLLFNFIARPDFIAYEFFYEHKFCRRLCAFLGAHSAGWTFTKKEQVKKYGDKFPTRIFEGFMPEK